MFIIHKRMHIAFSTTRIVQIIPSTLSRILMTQCKWVIIELNVLCILLSLPQTKLINEDAILEANRTTVHKTSIIFISEASCTCT